MPPDASRPRLSAPFRLSPLAARPLLAALALLLMFAVIVWREPRAASYLGLRLLLNFSIPLMFAAFAAMAVIVLGDIDLGLGPFIGLANVISARWLAANPGLAALLLVLSLLAYAAMGALIAARRLPSIVITLGASFIWLGAGLLILPTPGGAAPDWLAALLRLHTPFVPLPLWLAVALALAGQILFITSPAGVVLRGFGGAPEALIRAGWSLIAAKSFLYGLAGAFGILAGLALTGINTTGDANFGTPYTLLAIAAVIVGGGEFAGGIVSPPGTVIGALILLLSGALLSFLDVSTDWQLSVQGGILILVLALRALLRKRDAHAA
jgi:ribose/xylose/arabinose/galactoside ABC-type transport system permease subunit